MRMCVRARVRACVCVSVSVETGQTGQKAQIAAAAVTFGCPAYRDAAGQAGQLQRSPWFHNRSPTVNATTTQP